LHDDSRSSHAASARGASEGPRYRAAIIGTGRIASLLERDPLRTKPHTHAGWYRHHPRIDLVAGADVDPDRLAEFGADWGIAPSGLFSDYREMLDRVRPDIVSIAAYAPDRLQMIRDAVQAGARGLWIEKAIACSLGEAKEIERTLAVGHVAAIVDHPRRAQGRYRAVRRVIETRALGELEAVHCLMSGLVIHTGTHAWDVLDFWLGEPLHVTGWLDGDVPASGPVEDCGGHGRLEYPGGVHAWVTARRKRYFIFQFDLVFSEGRVQVGNDVWKVFVPEASRLYSGFRELYEAPAPPEDPYPYPMVYDLVRAIETGGEPLMSVSNAVSAFRTGLALFESHRQRHLPMPLAALDDGLRVVSQ
jgi:predicted dehydrogenase